MDKAVLDRQLWELRVPMLRLALSILRHPQNAEDAVSAAMVRAYQQIRQLREEAALKAWVLRIMANCCYDLLRSYKREQPQQDVAPRPIFQPMGQPSLLDMVLRLPPPFAQVLTLYYYEGYATAEIARVLDVAAPAVYMRLSRGRQMLRRILEEDERDQPGI